MKPRRRTDSEDLSLREDLVRPAREDLGWSDDRGFGQREDLGGGGFGQREDLRKASPNRKSGKIMANLKIAENYFTLATACRRGVRPPGLEPGTN